MVNSIQDKFQTKHVFRDNIIQDVQQRYGSFCTSRKSLIEQEKERFEFFDDLELEEAAQKGAQEVPFPALTQAQLDLIHRKLRSGNEVVADKFNLKIRGQCIGVPHGAKISSNRPAEIDRTYLALRLFRFVLDRQRGGGHVAVLGRRHDAAQAATVEHEHGGAALESRIATLALPVAIARLAQRHISVGVFIAEGWWGAEETRRRAGLRVNENHYHCHSVRHGHENTGYECTTVAT
uniref:Uncharacterized protein n=1 Tax=Anopheles atroparvus TaxID=41427 RepID=A0A182IQA3_ANOAO